MDMALCHSLVAVTVVAFSIGAFQPACAGMALFLNLVVCAIVSSATGYGFNFMLLASIDMITAVAILMLPRSRCQILLAGTYAFGLACHAAFAALGAPKSAEDAYWLALYYMAWGQLWLTVFWTGGELVSMVRSGIYPWSRLYARWHLSRQVDKHGKAKG